MDRKQAYAKIAELGLQEAVKKAYGRNFTQVPTAGLEEIINKAGKPAPKKEEKVKDKPIQKVSIPKVPSMKGSIEGKFAKLVELLAKRRILLDSELTELANA